MRENNRKPIEKCIKKLPQFTTMNVIDGQAGLVIYSSLIFYSLTIDNILNIIVLLILAGVSIAMLTGQNGILTQAQRAKSNTETASAKEKVQIAVMGSYDNSGNLSLEKLKTEIKNQGGDIKDSGENFILEISMDGYDYAIQSTGDILQVKKLGEITGQEKSNTLVRDNWENNIVVPAGFRVVNPTDNVEDGIIIEDADTSRATVGSQFVWIPIGTVKSSKGNKIVNLSRYTFDSSTGQPTDQGNNIIDGYYQESVTANEENIERFKISATENHGFYVGRYEAKDGTTKEERTEASSDTNQLVCTADNSVYNWVNQLQAETLSKNMYVNENFSSDLINSYAWDTAIVFLQEFDDREDKTTPYSNQNSLNTGTLEVQGTNKLSNKDVICNIYDMASNCTERTTENSSGAHTCVGRGGSYNIESYYASSRYGYYENSRYPDIAFRTILYI